MQKSILSARAAAAYLGFATSNPILDAIHTGELPAERGRPGRNGQLGNFRIHVADLDKWASTHGLELSDGSIVHMPEAIAEAPSPAPTPTTAPEVFNVASVLRGADALITIPLSYLNGWIERAIEAELRAAKAEAEVVHAYMLFDPERVEAAVPGAKVRRSNSASKG